MTDYTPTFYKKQSDGYKERRFKKRGFGITQGI